MIDGSVVSWSRYIKAASSPKNMVILVDTSGSMKGRRRIITVKTIQKLLETLSDDDHFNIITASLSLFSLSPSLSTPLTFIITVCLSLSLFLSLSLSLSLSLTSTNDVWPVQQVLHNGQWSPFLAIPRHRRLSLLNYKRTICHTQTLQSMLCSELFLLSLPSPETTQLLFLSSFQMSLPFFSPLFPWSLHLLYFLESSCWTVFKSISYFSLVVLCFKQLSF